MPAAQRLEALVVGGVDTGDADRVVHLLTRDGRLDVFAPQAKKSRKRFGGALEPFTTIEAHLSARRSKKASLPTMSEATVLRARLALRRSLEVIALASYFGELGYRTAPEGQASAVAPLVEAAWAHLADHAPSPRVRRAFELRLMIELGYHPELAVCVACGVAPDPVYLDLARGGVVCSIHRGGASVIGPKTRQWLHAVAAQDEFDPDAGLPEAWADTAATKVATPFGAFWESLLDRPLKATTLLAEVGLT